MSINRLDNVMYTCKSILDEYLTLVAEASKFESLSITERRSRLKEIRRTHSDFFHSFPSFILRFNRDFDFADKKPKPLTITDDFIVDNVYDSDGRITIHLLHPMKRYKGYKIEAAIVCPSGILGIFNNYRKIALSSRSGDRFHIEGKFYIRIKEKSFIDDLYIEPHLSLRPVNSSDLVIQRIA